MNICNCPEEDALTDIAGSDCPFDMKQIQRIAFVKQGQVIWDSADGSGAGTEGVPQIDSQLDTLADWEARRVAVDATKIVVTPLIGGDPLVEAGEAITEGGNDNSTLNGEEEVTGKSPSLFSCMFKSLSPDSEKTLQALQCFKLEAYFFLEGGRIAAKQINGGPTIQGFQISSYFVSDRNNAGFGTKDTNLMRFSLAPGWSNDLVIVSPADFNPLYDI